MKSKISNNALKILEYLLSNNAMAGKDATVQDIYNSIGLSETDFDAADIYLLQNKYVEGTIGGMEGSRWLTARGIDFYESNDFQPEFIPVHQESEKMPDPKKVFVVHGRDNKLREDFFSFLRALGLQPIEWSEALKLTGSASPYIGDVLEKAFQEAQAVIVILSPDDEVRLLPELWGSDEEKDEKEISLQPRPNVLFEAGLAFGTHPGRTLLIEVGKVKRFSDIAGRHTVRLSNKISCRKDIAQRLKDMAKCAVSTDGNDWMNIGNFDIKRDMSKRTNGYVSSDLDTGDIFALLHDWWSKSEENFSDAVLVNYQEVDKELFLPPGSTKKYINWVASRKKFVRTTNGKYFARFEYKVSPEDFGEYHKP